ncbi:MAG: hypothetical protein C0596_13015 [Marinilabiliales bacterium]|nr:MAG: hypothetical protein C0596_13015 [Marinilabiliales bacterium]
MKNNFKYHIGNNNSLMFIYDNLKLSSAPGRNMLMNTYLITDRFQLKLELEFLAYTFQFYTEKLSPSDLNDIALRLHSFKDIKATLENLKNKSTVLDDIQLFEIKNFVIIKKQIATILESKGFDIFEFHNADEILSILDPDNTGENSFYIYSSYSERLQELRKELSNVNIDNSEKDEEIRLKCIEEEDKIRLKLSKKLRNFEDILSQNFKRLAHFDILLAKSILIDEFNLCEPQLYDKIEYRELFNPYVKSILKEKGRKYQPIDISLENQPVLITGANMSGKTVLLRTLALSQLMFQFGFYVPAESANMILFDDIVLNIGDQHNELNGLSSFAVEMTNINQIIVESKKGTRIFALVDELARTTNPVEGKLLVSAFIEMMRKYNVCSPITTHYSGIKAECKRLRVKGLSNISESDKITVENINDFMDYSLSEVNTDSVTNEAIRIAEILGVDEEYLGLIKK